MREHPIHVERLPGQSGKYIAERNYLVLERTAGKWTAQWDLEASGMTEAMVF